VQTTPLPPSTRVRQRAPRFCYCLLAHFATAHRTFDAPYPVCARCAHGAAQVLSNHGGRQLDGCPGAFDALSAVAAAVSRHRTLHGVSGDEVKWPVMLDGGVRRGTDVVKALASENNKIRATGINIQTST